jgi:hypothetical protein
MHGLPKDYRGRIETWLEAVEYLDALVASEKPLVVDVGDGGQGFLTQATVQGLLQRSDWRPPDDHHAFHEDRFRVVPFVAKSAVGRGRYYEPLDLPVSKFGLGVEIRFASSRFISGTLHTMEDDCYFGLMLWMGGIAVGISDANTSPGI